MIVIPVMKKSCRGVQGLVQAFKIRVVSAALNTVSPMGDRCYPDGWAHITWLLYIYLSFMISQQIAPDLYFRCNQTMGSTRQTSRGPFFSIGFTHYMSMYLCVIFFCVYFFRSLCAVEVVSHMYSSTFNYIDAPSK